MMNARIPLELDAWDRGTLLRIAEQGTPAYVYDINRLQARVEELRYAFRGFPHRLYFATMANDRPEVLLVLSKQGVGACVNSVPHLRLAQECGFPRDEIQFTSTGVPASDLALLHRSGIAVNLDSERQLQAWLKVGGGACGLRVNAGALGSLPAADRIGMAEGNLQQALRIASEADIAVEGLHIYVGTNFQRPEQMLPTLEAFFRVASTVTSLRYVNIGGGIGVDYSRSGTEFDVKSYGEGLRQLYDTHLAPRQRPVQVIVEPGRGMAARCGVFLTRIADIKELGGTRYVAVDASIATFPRPLHHPESPHKISLVEPDPCGARTQTALIVGRTTFSRDILGSAELPSDVQVGQVLLLADSGAYSQSMMSRFLGQPEPSTHVL